MVPSNIMFFKVKKIEPGLTFSLQKLTNKMFDTDQVDQHIVIFSKFALKFLNKFLEFEYSN